MDSIRLNEFFPFQISKTAEMLDGEVSNGLRHRRSSREVIQTTKEEALVEDSSNSSSPPKHVSKKQSKRQIIADHLLSLAPSLDFRRANPSPERPKQNQSVSVIPVAPPQPPNSVRFNLGSTRSILAQLKRTYPTYESAPALALTLGDEQKTAEFRKFFNEVPSDEIVIAEMPCALKFGVLVDGKLWVSEHHLCFRSWTGRKVVVDFTDIVHIEKKNFAGIIPNALSVETTTDKYFFGTIAPPRDPKFEFLLKMWSLHVDSESLFRKCPDLSNVRCLCLEKTPDLCDYCAKRTALKEESLKKHSSQRLSTTSNGSSGSKSATKAAPIQSDELSTKDESMRRNAVRNTSQATIVTVTNADGEITAHMEDDDAANDSNDCGCAEGSQNGFSVVLDTTLPISVEEVWRKWSSSGYDDSITGIFLTDVMKFRDVKASPWVAADDPDPELLPAIHPSAPLITDSSVVKVGWRRKTYCIVPLTAPFGPKQTRSCCTETILGFDQGKYFCKDIRNESVDVSTTFYANGRACVSQVSPKSSRLVVKFRTVFLKGNMLKGVIEKFTLDELRAFYSKLAEFIEKNHNRDCQSLTKDYIASNPPPPIPARMPAEIQTPSKESCPNRPASIVHKVVEYVASQARDPEYAMNMAFICVCILILTLIINSASLYYAIKTLEDTHVRLASLESQLSRVKQQHHHVSLDIFEQQ